MTKKSAHSNRSRLDTSELVDHRLPVTPVIHAPNVADKSLAAEKAVSSSTAANHSSGDVIGHRAATNFTASATHERHDVADRASSVGDRHGAVRPSQRVTINTVADDDRIHAAELAAGVTVSGLADVSGQVRVRWGTTVKIVNTDAAGQWSVDFSKAEIPVNGARRGDDNDIRAQLIDGVTGQVSAATRHRVLVDAVAPKAPTLVVDTQVTEAEASAGVNVSGLAEARATVLVKWGDVSRTVTANERGAWRATFEAAEIMGVDPAGRTVEVSAQATDLAGNTGDVARQMVSVAGMSPGAAQTPVIPVAIDVVAGDNVVVAKEGKAGVVVAGIATAGRWFEVKWGDTTKLALTDATGNWKVNFGSDQVPVADGVAVDLTARLLNPSASDLNLSVTKSVLVDTVVPDAPLILTVADDGKVNAAEAAAGVVVKGTAGVNTDVTVTWGATSRVVTSDETGAWSLQFTATEMPSHPHKRSITAAAVDDSGNVSEASRVGVLVDLVAPATPWVYAVAGDNRITAEEALAGVTVAGLSEPRASLSVLLGQVSKTVTADKFGRWSAPFVSTEILGDSAGTANLSVLAMDDAGNTSAVMSRQLTVDAPPVTVLSSTLAEGWYLSQAVLA
jgi:large repetitive protein